MSAPDICWCCGQPLDAEGECEHGCCSGCENCEEILCCQCEEASENEASEFQDDATDEGEL